MRWLPMVGLALALAGTPVLAQDVDRARQELVARGAPASFIDDVSGAIASAEARGLPTEPLLSKALEGWAKHEHVPLARVVAVLEQLATRLESGRELATEAGLTAPPGAVVAAAAEALGRGLSPSDVRSLVEAAPSSEEAAVGLTVAASLAAQGLETAAAARVVRDAHQQGRGADQVLEFPSAVADLLARGVPMSEVAQEILSGRGLPGVSPPGGGQGRPSTVPPGSGRSRGRGNKKSNGS